MKVLSVASWNVQHFGADPSDDDRVPQKEIGPIIEFLAAQEADVVAIYEVVGSRVFLPISLAMPDYNFHITEGPQSQEILVGLRRNVTGFFTQRLEFKSGQQFLRPGALLTVAAANGERYPLLFLHLKSSATPKGFGLRDDMIERALDFQKTLQEHAIDKSPVNYLFLGDLNTMGMKLTYSDKDIDTDEEIARLSDRAAKRGMRLLRNTGPSWWPREGSAYPVSALDHVVAAKHLTFKNFAEGESDTPVQVRGWPELATDEERHAWRKSFSDHALLYFEIHA